MRDLRARQEDPAAWLALRRYTDARIALGRVGASLPTREILDFDMAHARARDAVQTSLDTSAFERQLHQAGFATLHVHSRAADRSEYLRRPDLGRQLAPECHEALRIHEPMDHRLTIAVADGLSASAAAHHAIPLLMQLRSRLTGWSIDAVVIATQARVALADEIGELRGSEAVAILIGERPGLSSPNSLGIYMTYSPRRGRTDAERNCLSNIRVGGLSYSEAAFRLQYLLGEARLQGQSGVTVKDLSVWREDARIAASISDSSPGK
ncbi:MAG TPA: ethanolamine ammonia-lyase subunit EutC [Acidobacteriaceae bacterium]